MKYYVLIALCLIAFTAMAAERDKVVAEPLSGKKIESEAVLTPEDQAILLCQAADIMGENKVPSAEYQPGIDAHGNAVAPADGGAEPQYTIPDRIDIPLDIAILQTVGVVTTATPELSTNIGTISILKGGQVLYNGKEATGKIQSYCKTHMKAETK
jgi:hypothetical protein